MRPKQYHLRDTPSHACLSTVEPASRLCGQQGPHYIITRLCKISLRSVFYTYRHHEDPMCPDPGRRMLPLIYSYSTHALFPAETFRSSLNHEGYVVYICCAHVCFWCSSVFARPKLPATPFGFFEPHTRRRKFMRRYCNTPNTLQNADRKNSSLSCRIFTSPVRSVESGRDAHHMYAPAPPCGVPRPLRGVPPGGVP